MTFEETEADLLLWGRGGFGALLCFGISSGVWVLGFPVLFRKSYLSFSERGGFGF